MIATQVCMQLFINRGLHNYFIFKPFILFFDTNAELDKENNVNSSNLMKTYNIYNHLPSNKNGQSMQTNQVQNKNSLIDNDNKSISTGSVSNYIKF